MDWAGITGIVLGGLIIFIRAGFLWHNGSIRGSAYCFGGIAIGLCFKLNVARCSNAMKARCTNFFNSDFVHLNWRHLRAFIANGFLGRYVFFMLDDHSRHIFRVLGSDNTKFHFLRMHYFRLFFGGKIGQSLQQFFACA